MERVTFAIADGTLREHVLSGVAHTFGQRTWRNGGWMQFAPGAFDEALRTSDVRAFVNHSGVSAGEVPMILGRQSAGTLRLSAQSDGLHYAVDLPDTSYARDLEVSIARGDIKEMSFGILPGTITRSKAEDGKPLVTHTSVASIFDVSPVALPAFSEGTSIALHSTADESARSQAIRARARIRGRNS
jgi:HK97 family phage prohead protease